MADPPRDTPLALRLRLACFLILFVFHAAWIVGQVFRDRSWITGLCFYLPSPVVAFGALMLMLIKARARRWRSSAAALAFALLPLFFFVVIENNFGSASGAPPGREDLRLVHWNIMWGRLGEEAVIDELLARKADIHVISECEDDTFAANLARRAGEDFTSITFSTLAVVARGELNSETWSHKDSQMKLRPVEWTLDGRTLTLLVGDHDSSPEIHRHPNLLRLREVMISSSPDIVVGDFNAPRRSLALSPPPTGFRHAYDGAGKGLGCTWPLPLPLYAIDLCIIGPRVTPVRYELDSTTRSDHRMQIFDFRVTGPKSIQAR